MITRDRKLYKKYNTTEERIEGWKQNRKVYKDWRKSYSKPFIKRKTLRQRNLCFICMKPLGEQIHIDHIFPLYLGGTNTAANLCVTHPKCNMDKGTQVLMTYKQACLRRKLFNRFGIALRAYKARKENPEYTPSKRQKKALRYVSKKVNLEDYV